MKTATFRQHDTVPPNVASALYRQLLTEWVALNQIASSGAAVRKWGRREPTLAGYTRPGDLVDAIDSAAAGGKDEILGSLIRLFHAGHQLAGRTILQSMLPKLLGIAAQTSPTSSDNAWTEDRRHITVAEFWDVLAGYPLGRRPSHVAGNLALDTLRRVSGVRTPQADIPASDHIEASPTNVDDQVIYTLDPEANLGNLSAGADLTQVITWAVRHDIITASDATLIHEIYTTRAGTNGAYGFEAAATEIGLSPAAIRQRCSRAVRKVAKAAQAEINSDASPATRTHVA